MLTTSKRIPERLITSLVSGAVFAADWNETEKILTVHTCAKTARRSENDSHIRVAIRTHSRRALQSPRSLEALMLGGSDTKIVFDPTQIFRRAEILVRAIKTVRARLPDQIASCHFNAARRTLQITPHSSVDPARYDVLRLAVVAALTEIDAGAMLDDIAVRVASEMPNLEGSLPVDNLSVRPASRLRGVVRAAMVAMFSTGMLAGTAAHATPQAVNLGLLGGLSVFADGVATTASDGFVSTGLAYFFGDEGAAGQVELRLAQNAPGPGRSDTDIVIRTDGVSSEIEVMSGTIAVGACDSLDNLYLASRGQVIGVDGSCAVRYESTGQVGPVGSAGSGPGS